MSDLRALTILLLDDSEPMALLLRSILGGFGVQHMPTAHDCASALAHMRDSVVDLAIVDLQLGPEDGLEFIRTVRSDPGQDRFLPIIALSSDTRASRVFEARDAGVTEFCAKPVSIAHLGRKINEVILRPRPFIQTASYFGPDRRRWADPHFAGPERRHGLAATGPVITAAAQ